MFCLLVVADTGFLRGGGTTYDFAKCSQKLHEIEKNWTAGGRRRIQNFDWFKSIMASLQNWNTKILRRQAKLSSF